MDHFKNKHILSAFLFVLFSGTLFFIPAVFVSRFTTAPALWMQAGISFGMLGYVLLTKERILLPPKSFIILIAIWAVYHIWQNHGNIENLVTIITLVVTFFFFYIIWSRWKDKRFLFTLFSFLALWLSLWGLGQFLGQLPSYNGSFAVTGPFDNPAGISVSLVVLLPFLLYVCRFSGKGYRILGIIAVCLVVTVIALSQARAAVLATVIIFHLFFIRLLKERNIRLLPVHYTAISLSCLLLFAGLFYVKKDSASGRLLIWLCSGQMIASRPVFGCGGNGFTANYMNEQASYFIKHPDNKYTMLAGNIRHPFNEFLKWTVNYGIVGLCLTFLLIVIPLRASWKNNSQELFFIKLSLFSIGICALFSYPFNYPFIRIMAVALVTFMLATVGSEESTKVRNIYLVKGTAVLLSLGVLGVTAYQGFCEREWHRIAHKSLRGQTMQMLLRYEMLHAHLRHKDLFLYNYAAELNVSSKYNESLKIAFECEKLWADYDLQMLMADNCLQIQDYKETEQHLKRATTMCPVKFMPLYQLLELYLETGQKEKARLLAQKILDKYEKIPSTIVTGIKYKARKILIELDSTTVYELKE